MKRRMIILLLLAGMILSAGFISAEEEKKEAAKPDAEKAVKFKKQTVCPIMGNEINPEVFADIQGQRVYFCCEGCIDKFREDPEKYFGKAAKEGVLFENVQTTCPTCGEKVDKDFFSYHKGRGIYFCGEDCKKAFDAEPEKFLGKLQKPEGVKAEIKEKTEKKEKAEKKEKEEKEEKETGKN